MTPAATREQRRFSRILFDAPVTISSGKERWQSRLLDISLKGMLVQKSADWPVHRHDPVELSVRIPDSDTCIRMYAHQVHEEDGHIGYQCDHIDLGSISSLKRLVELNLSDPKTLDRELAALSEA